MVVYNRPCMAHSKIRKLCLLLLWSQEHFELILSFLPLPLTSFTEMKGVKTISSPGNSIMWKGGGRLIDTRGLRSQLEGQIFVSQMEWCPLVSDGFVSKNNRNPVFCSWKTERYHFNLPKQWTGAAIKPNSSYCYRGEKGLLGKCALHLTVTSCVKQDPPSLSLPWPRSCFSLSVSQHHTTCSIHTHNRVSESLPCCFTSLTSSTQPGFGLERMLVTRTQRALLRTVCAIGVSAVTPKQPLC